MDRFIVFNGENIYEEDLLKTNLFSMIGLAKLTDCVIGNSVSFNRLGCVPTSPPSLNVTVNPGEIYELQNIDNSTYGSLPADTVHQIVKQGILLDAVNLSCPAPSTVGFAIDYLIEFAYTDTDTDDENRTFYNASPQVVATVRQGQLIAQAKAGTAATYGTQVPPSPDAGYTGAYVVTVQQGQTTITSGDIAVASGAPFVTEKLKDKISQATADLRYGQIATIQSGGYLFSLDTGTANTYVAALTPAITSYTNGMKVRVKIANSNTGASTLNVNSLGAVAIVHGDGTPLLAGDLTANAIVEFIYSATANNFILDSVQQQQFTNSLSSSGYQKMPGGLIFQWGRDASSPSGATITFPIPFPNACFQVIASDSGNDAASFGADTFTTTNFKLYSTSTFVGRWFAVGN